LRVSYCPMYNVLTILQGISQKPTGPGARPWLVRGPPRGASGGARPAGARGPGWSCEAFPRNPAWVLAEQNVLVAILSVRGRGRGLESLVVVVVGAWSWWGRVRVTPQRRLRRRHRPSSGRDRKSRRRRWQPRPLTCSGVLARFAKSRWLVSGGCGRSP